ncbi:enoyl-CoA hydratase/isomerase family protein [Glaciihabitans sp. INWT7]|uniref:enoyl-CoA hydratase/isomerase family protein n=1 Tax=Glaciihabitans sp. INWT7 TaxID=2596912 RepID=UPI0016243B89|nr:enoyl-CoA hydratase/isomerase family protein [Glaciihabitans sp. INWT7]QNE47195.1 enoyl-CoA hydratase/isomerase family protein [Glaciihabitans sp. INWT7]
MAGLSVHRAGVVATLVIENALRRNALSAEMWQQLPPLLSRLAGDDSVKVLIVRGAGEDFSAGADIRELDGILNAPTGQDGGYLTEAENALAGFPQPTIAAIDGYCVGGGWQLAAACDIRIASSRATFGVTPSRIGIVYPLSGIERLVSVAGVAVAKYLLFSGDLVDAATAERWGMVTSVVEAHDLWSEADGLANRLAARSQLSIHAMKQIVDAIASGADTADVNQRWQVEVAGSDDPAIGAAAFAAKQAPEFTWAPRAPH